MSFTRQRWLAMLASLGGSVLLAGCQGLSQQSAHAPPAMEHTPRLNARQQADVQVAFARSLEKSGTSDQAAAAYEDALKKDPKRADAHDRLAIMHARKGQFEQAVALHKKALALQPGNADFVCNLGYCYYLQQRWAEAEIQFRKAIEITPNHSRALNNLGLVLGRTDRSREALTAFRRAGCSEADAHSNLAFVLTLESSWQDAQQHYARAHELDPASSPAEKGLRAVSAQLNPPESPPARPHIEHPKAPIVFPAQAIQTAPAPMEIITRVPPNPDRQLIEIMPEPQPLPMQRHEATPISELPISWSNESVPVPTAKAPERPPIPKLEVRDGPPPPIQYLSGVMPVAQPKSVEASAGEAKAPPTRPVMAAPEPAKKFVPVKAASAVTDHTSLPIEHIVGTTALPGAAPAAAPVRIEQLHGITPVR